MFGGSGNVGAGTILAIEDQLVEVAAVCVNHFVFKPFAEAIDIIGLFTHEQVQGLVVLTVQLLVEFLVFDHRDGVVCGGKDTKLVKTYKAKSCSQGTAFHQKIKHYE